MSDWTLWTWFCLFGAAVWTVMLIPAVRGELSRLNAVIGVLSTIAIMLRLAFDA